ncbi:hypothetical protein [Haladaptatus sp. DYF46]|uniref:hypothetical protein n=1 Tax=Haladaptatus sp. DYF46 TaxID=2886041 RepID=UPI001E285860|nr:hypothetical protein [Haladaptatus sp. DYF46]
MTVGSSLSSDAPGSKVGLSYRHMALDQQTTDYIAEKWTERYNISKTYASARTDLDIEIPFQSNVVRIRNVSVQRNGSMWNEPSWGFNEGSLHIHPDDVGAETTLNVRVNGSKVDVDNGAIRVLVPTAPGDALNSKIKITDREPGFAIDVGGTADGQRLHYLTNESWQGAAPYTEHLENGAQWIYTPNAGNGSTARVKTLPLEVSPQGDVLIDVTDPDTNAFHVHPGDTAGDSVAYRWLDATTGEDYVLYSNTNDVVRDAQSADGTVELLDDDSEETLRIMLDESGSSSSGGSFSGSNAAVVPISSSGGLLDSIPVVIGVAVLAIAGVALLLSRKFKSNEIVLGGTAATALVALVIAGEGISPGVLLGPIGENVGRVIPVVLLITTGTLAYYFYVRFIRGYTTIVEIGGERLK